MMLALLVGWAIFLPLGRANGDSCVEGLQQSARGFYPQNQPKTRPNGLLMIFMGACGKTPG
jgi:hypothetical protein